MKKTLIISLIAFTAFGYLTAQSEIQNEEKIKKGWTFGAFPVFGYDSNTGFKYGGFLSLYDYGDGTKYPQYNQRLNLELSRTTKGSGTNQLTYDTKNFIPGVRMLAEASFLTEKVLNFYGFNGYNSYYDPAFENKEDPLFKSQVFYRMERSMLKMKLEFIGKLKGDNLKWFGGVEYLNNKLDTVDIDNLNEGKDPADMIQSTGGGLYGDFIRWGLIPEDQINGGGTSIFKIGAKFDTRDNEANPMKGLWTELQFLVSPSFLSDGYGYTRMAFTHRQYFTIISKKVNFAYRFSYQAKLTGEIPFHMLPLVYNSAPQLTLSGLGGAKTMRGIMRNRVAGDDFIYGNAELRWKVIKTVILNQNFYIALAGFADAGMITGNYKLPEVTNPQFKDEAEAWLSAGDPEKLHVSYGFGLHFAVNDNFIVTWDYGLAADKRDGKKGTYIGMGFLF